MTPRDIIANEKAAQLSTTGDFFKTITSEGKSIISSGETQGGMIMAEHVIFNDVKYYRTTKGYWARQGKTLQAAVWEFHHGTIPDGYEIHHVDGDRNNNAIENLQCLTIPEHHQIHAEARLKERTCSYCGKKYKAKRADGKFCTPDCRQAWLKARRCRRVKRICSLCGKEFETDRRRNARFCSQKCVVAATKHLREKLSSKQVEEIRAIYVPYDLEFGGTALAKKYGVSESVIYRAVHGDTHQSVSGDVHERDKTHRRKLSLDDAKTVRNIYVEGDAQFGATALADKYGVTTPVILSIIYGRTYKDAGGIIRKSQSAKGRSLTAKEKMEVKRLYVKDSREFGIPALSQKFGVGTSTIYRAIRS